MTKSLFDTDNYIAINESRWAVAVRVIRFLRERGLPMESAFDLGCGPGWFSARLSGESLDVIGLEGREDVLAMARDRDTQSRFQQFDFDGASSEILPAARDFVLSFGLLYHLENPIRALRISRALTGSTLLMETMVSPGDDMTGLIAVENRNETQGLRNLSLILTPTAIAFTLRAAGFDHVAKFEGEVDHVDFKTTADRLRRRDIFLASDHGELPDGFVPIDLPPHQRADYWAKPGASS